MASEIDLSIYNRAEVLANLDGDEAFLGSLAAIFVADSARYCSALSQVAGDRVALALEAHTLKSLFATFSAHTGVQLAQQLEAQAKVGNLENGEALIAELIITIERLSAALAED
jgi:HPt (histidine-containing phosphotransfer) domain-containing protein